VTSSRSSAVRAATQRGLGRGAARDLGLQRAPAPQQAHRQQRHAEEDHRHRGQHRQRAGRHAQDLQHEDGRGHQQQADAQQHMPGARLHAGLAQRQHARGGEAQHAGEGARRVRHVQPQREAGQQCGARHEQRDPAAVGGDRAAQVDDDAQRRAHRRRGQHARRQAQRRRGQVQHQRHHQFRGEHVPQRRQPEARAQPGHAGLAVAARQAEEQQREGRQHERDDAGGADGGEGQRRVLGGRHRGRS